MSFPSRERGLKWLCIRINFAPCTVVPLAGTWIEIIMNAQSGIQNSVVPLAGTWIEMAVMDAL